MSTHAKISVKQAILDIVAAASAPPTVAFIVNTLRDNYQIPTDSKRTGGNVQSLVSSGYLNAIKNPQDSRAANTYNLDKERTKRPLHAPQQHQMRSEGLKSKVLDIMRALGRPVTSRDVQAEFGDVAAVATPMATMARMGMIIPLGIVRVRRHDEPTKTTPMMSYACNPNFNEAAGSNKRAKLGDPEHTWAELLIGRRYEDAPIRVVGIWRGNGTGLPMTMTGSTGAMCADASR